MTVHGPGRLRVRLAALLQAEGLDFRPEDLHSERPGYWQRSQGACSWWAQRPGAMLPTVLSWDTMAECVRRGIVVSDGRSNGHNDVWVDAKGDGE